MERFLVVKKERIDPQTGYPDQVQFWGKLSDDTLIVTKEQYRTDLMRAAMLIIEPEWGPFKVAVNAMEWLDRDELEKIIDERRGNK